MSEWIGWTATVVFVCSYFVRPSRLLAVQVAGALTWLAYGLLTGQPPVVVSNVIVAAAAGYRLAGPPQAGSFSLMPNASRPPRTNAPASSRNPSE